jgi:serine/threonine protein kinase
MSTEDSDSELSQSSDENLEQTENLDLTGEILNNYNIICELGRGSFSIVWLAYNISNNNFYAIKVQDPSEYKAGLSEIMFVQNLPKNPAVFNNIIEHFTEIRAKPNSREKAKYLCSVWELHCCNIDNLIRKGKYKDGLPLPMVRSIMKQLIEAVYILHRKFKVFHGDIKTDNIFVKGINDKDMYIIEQYKMMNFFECYSNAKQEYCKNNNKQIENLKKEEKLFIRKTVHKNITNRVITLYEKSGIMKHSINNMYLDEIKISLGDFGTHCSEDNYYDEAFGTRYYMAPEIILMGKCSLPVDIWALGCTFYELLTGNLLFDPEKDSHHSRDYYHLQLISDTCGELSPSCIKKTKYYKKFFTKDYKLIDYEVPDENRLERKLKELNNNESVKKLLVTMLQPEISKRTTVDNLIKEKFFE